jgi:hypothetical protein
MLPASTPFSPSELQQEVARLQLYLVLPFPLRLALWQAGRGQALRYMSAEALRAVQQVQPRGLAGLDDVIAADLAAQGIKDRLEGGLAAAVHAMVEGGWLVHQQRQQQQQGPQNAGWAPGSGSIPTGAAAGQQQASSFTWVPGPWGPPPQALVQGSGGGGAAAAAADGVEHSAQYRQLHARFDEQRQLVVDLQRTLARQGTALQRCTAGGLRSLLPMAMVVRSCNAPQQQQQHSVQRLCDGNVWTVLHNPSEAP